MKPARNAPIALRRDHLLTRLGGTVTGIVAIVVSWTVRDPNTVWCRQPRRWRHDAKSDS